MNEYDEKVLNEMTVERYIVLDKSSNEDENNEASDAVCEILDYLYSNVKGVSDLEIEDWDVTGDKMYVLASFKTGCEDANIIQKDVDDFVSSDIETEFDGLIEVKIDDLNTTFIQIAEKMKDEIERQAEREIDYAIEKAAEEYREYHHSRGNYFI